jgi:hypothetical protein
MIALISFILSLFTSLFKSRRQRMPRFDIS